MEYLNITFILTTVFPLHVKIPAIDIGHSFFAFVVALLFLVLSILFELIWPKNPLKSDAF
jgi:hypothetical protein